MMVFMMALWLPKFGLYVLSLERQQAPQQWFNGHFCILSAVFSSVVSADNPFQKWMLSLRPFTFSLHVLNCSQE